MSGPPRPSRPAELSEEAPTWWSTLRSVGSGLMVVGAFVATAAITIASLATSSASSNSSSHSEADSSSSASSDPLERAQRLRSEAHSLKADRDRHYNDSQACFARGDGAGAKAASDRRKQTHQRIEKLHAEAASLFFQHHNAHRGLDTIDLHCLHVEEALAQLTRRIEACEKRLRSAPAGEEGVVRRLVVIVGRGNHSRDGIAKIRPAVENLIRTHRLLVIPDQPNAGCLTIEFGSNAVNESSSQLGSAMDRCVIM